MTIAAYDSEKREKRTSFSWTSSSGPLSIQSIKESQSNSFYVLDIFHFNRQKMVISPQGGRINLPPVHKVPLHKTKPRNFPKIEGMSPTHRAKVKQQEGYNNLGIHETYQSIHQRI